jgi:hypothetical protein
MWQTWSIVTSPVNMHEVWEVQRCQKEAEIKIDQRCMGTWRQWPTSRVDGFDCGQSAQGAATAAWLGAGSRAGRGTRLPVSWRGEGFWSCRSKLAIEPSVIIQAGSITRAVLSFCVLPQLEGMSVKTNLHRSPCWVFYQWTIYFGSMIS